MQQDADLRQALEANGAVYAIKEEGIGYINLRIADHSDNLAKVSAAMDSMGMGCDSTGDWGARSIGSYMFEKDSAL